MPKYVVSSTIQQPEWQNTTVLSGDPVAAVADLRNEVDGIVLIAGLVQTLLENDLVNELRLMIFPVLLGGGKRLFPEGEAKTLLKLTEAKTVGDGVSLLRYEPRTND
jgi:dihydrofolate reductase